jgi:hypothetical protein
VVWLTLLVELDDSRTHGEGRGKNIMKQEFIPPGLRCEVKASTSRIAISVSLRKFSRRDGSHASPR